jgi:hypothetical protein
MDPVHADDVRGTRSNGPEEIDRDATLLHQEAFFNVGVSQEFHGFRQQRRLLDGVDKTRLVSAPATSGDGHHRIAVRDIAKPPQLAAPETRTRATASMSRSI